VLPPVIAVLAHMGEAARYEEFSSASAPRATPQDEQRYLYARRPSRRPRPRAPDPERAINGEIRTQDAPFVVRGMLMSVDARRDAWAFVKAHWDTMDRLYPKHGMAPAAEGVTGLATPALERTSAASSTRRSRSSAARCSRSTSSSCTWRWCSASARAAR